MGLFTERDNDGVDTTTSFKFAITSIIIIAVFAIGFSIYHDKENVTNAEGSYLSSLQKIDSLQSIVNDLESQLQIQEDGFDKKEQRYEDILFEYKFGLERLRETHPSAYKEFHRIIAFKDRYRLEDERENNKRLLYK